MIFLEGDRCISKTHRSEFESVGGIEEAVVDHAGERSSYEKLAFAFAWDMILSYLAGHECYVSVTFG